MSISLLRMKQETKEQSKQKRKLRYVASENEAGSEGTKQAKAEIAIRTV